MLGGLLLAGLAVHFLLFQPPLLPEDERYVGTPLTGSSLLLRANRARTRSGR